MLTHKQLRWKFADQQAKEKRQDRAYRESLRGASAQQALDTVQEPWQLSIVIDLFAHQSEFWDVPGAYQGSKGTCVGNLIRSYQSDDPERHQLLRAALDYVWRWEGRNWDYTGT